MPSRRYVILIIILKIIVSEIAKVIGEDEKKEEPSLIVKEESSGDANTTETNNTSSGSVENNTNTTNPGEGDAQPSEQQTAEDDAVSTHLTWHVSLTELHHQPGLVFIDRQHRQLPGQHHSKRCW